MGGFGSFNVSVLSCTFFLFHFYIWVFVFTHLPLLPFFSFCFVLVASSLLLCLSGCIQDSRVLLLSFEKIFSVCFLFLAL